MENQVFTEGPDFHTVDMMGRRVLRGEMGLGEWTHCICVLLALLLPSLCVLGCESAVFVLHGERACSSVDVYTLHKEGAVKVWLFWARFLCI